jgi:IclR family acetate operon transcriptional repressor
MSTDKTRDPLAKGLRLLRFIMLKPTAAVSVREAAEALEMPASSVHRILGMLTREGFLRQHPVSGQYTLALDFYRLAHIVTGHTPLQAIALRHMRSLVAACNEAAFLSLYDPGRQQMITVASVESSHPLRYVVETHAWKPIHVGASGFAIMAFLPAAERAAIMARTGLHPVTERSITDPRQLEEILAEVRVRGYACTHGLRIPGAVGIAVPVFGPDGLVLGDVGLTVPEQRFAAGSEPVLAALLADCAASIMAETGGQRREA